MLEQVHAEAADALSQVKAIAPGLDDAERFGSAGNDAASHGWE